MYTPINKNIGHDKKEKRVITRKFTKKKKDLPKEPVGYRAPLLSEASGLMAQYRSKSTKIDPEVVRELAMIQCSAEEIAILCHCSAFTIKKQFKDVIEHGKTHGHMSLKRQQYKKAMEGSVPMLIWLGKVWLRQKEDEISTTHQAEVSEIMEQLKNASPIPDQGIQSTPKAETEENELAKPDPLPIS